MHGIAGMALSFSFLFFLLPVLLGLLSCLTYFWYLFLGHKKRALISPETLLLDPSIDPQFF